MDIVIDSSAYSDISIQDIIGLESKTQKEKYKYLLNKQAICFFKEKLIPVIENDLYNELNRKFDVSLDESELAIYVKYPTHYDDSYIRNSVKLEIGPIAAWTPNEVKSVSSFIQQEYPTLFNYNSFNVLVTLPERTFWEKVLILHQEANRSSGILPSRYSRHYYDIYKMYENIAQKAINNLDLLNEVRQFAITFYNRSWSGFENAQKPTFKLCPNEKYISELKKDYNLMQKMIFGSKVDFDVVLEIINKLENQINNN